MIITYPIQLPYSLGKEQRVVPDPVYNNSEILSGSFPMGKNRFWHGGVHIHPADRNIPIRAIADGELVAYRYDEADAKDDFFDKVPYSRSFVLLKHETVMGQTTLGTSRLTFYSLYMHLQAWNEVKDKKDAQAVNFLKKLVPEHAQTDKDGKPVLDKHKKPVMVKAHVDILKPVANGACNDGSGNAKVNRGDILGYCGDIPDNLATPSRGIHFEILLNDVQFLDNSSQTVWGQCILTDSLEVRDELLKKQTLSVDPKKPLVLDKRQNGGGYTKLLNDKHALWVSDDQLTTEEIEVPDPKHKGKKLKHTQHKARDKNLQVYDKDPVKNVSTLAKGTPVIPWLDPLLKSGEFLQEEHEGKTWVPIFTPDNNKLHWAEKTEIKYSSDADWPDFQKMEEHGQYSDDGFIDDEGMQKLLEAYDKDRAEASKDKLAQDEKKLQHLITKHPTEWSKQDIAKRFGRVATDSFGPSKLTPEQFAKLTKHIERLAFWEDVPNLPDAKGVWHAHPIRFIEQLAKCMWLSDQEIYRLMPQTKAEVVSAHALSLNKTMLQWGFSDRLEQSHYLAQGEHESGGMSLMTELPSKYASSASHYKGRGFVQITSEGNYKAFNSYVVKYIRNVDVVANPELLGSDSYLAFAASCWYWRSNDVRRSAHKGFTDEVVDEVGRVINRGPGRRDEPDYPPVNREDRLDKFHQTKEVLLD
ncbi:glycoside hydrolase family 19 protein [Collimonas humicola]|uniref:glycoside hydrolase family 19 protein n=1 Tax=Collimonas humicola TaxID=2825886 RepID=UPI001B8CCD9B|nr:glycoside hydrolase family 19 protein [Collimonas humicola]